jgi:hypothetical protein
MPLWTTMGYEITLRLDRSPDSGAYWKLRYSTVGLPLRSKPSGYNHGNHHRLRWYKLWIPGRSDTWQCQEYHGW